MASRSLSLHPTQVLLYLPPNDGSPGLFPSSSRFFVTETQDGAGHARNEGLHWESSDPAIARTEADGTVHAVATGSVLLSVRMSDQPALMATASVIVKDGGRADVVLE
ncbi:Bacterial Ig-like domain (group 2) [compost metagenome]